MQSIDHRIQELQSKADWLPAHARSAARRGVVWRVSPYSLVELNTVSACSGFDEEEFGIVEAATRAVDSRWQTPSAEFSRWTPHLTAAGYRSFGACAGLSRATATPIAPPPGVVVREVYDEPTLRAWHRIRRRVGRDHVEPDAAQLAAELDLIGRGVMRLVVAEHGEVIAAAGMTMPHDSAAAWLWGGATRPDAEGRGAYRALVAWRVAEAAARGRTEVLTVARADTSVPMLERMGFAMGGPWECWERAGTRSLVSDPPKR